MPFHRKMTPQMIAAREELYAMFAVTPQQITAARNPSASIGALAGRRQHKQAQGGGVGERKADEAN